MSDTSKIRSSNQLFVDADFDVRVHKIKNLTAGTATGHATEFDQVNLAIKTAVDPILATIHAPVATATAAKAIAAAERANAQTMLIEALGLFWYDADNASASNDDTFIRPTDVSSDAVAGRWVRHYQTKLYQPNGANPFVYTDNSGQLHIDGNIIQSGTNYITHAEHIYTTKDLIILRENAIAGLANGAFVGFKAKLYDGVNDGHLVFDNTGTARVGDVGSEQPIATRIETPTNGHYAVWESASSRLNFVAAGLAAIGNGTAQYQVPVTGATTFTPAWTTATNLFGTGGLNALSWASASFVKMTAANTFELRTLAQTLSDIGAAPASGSVNYIQNQSAGAQTNASMWIDGSGKFGYQVIAEGALISTTGIRSLIPSSANLDYGSGTRVLSIGADNATAGSFQVALSSANTAVYLTPLIIANTGAATFSSSVCASSFTDGFITWAAAQINRYGSNIEFQFTPTVSSTVRIGANGNYPTTFYAESGMAVFSNKVTATQFESTIATATGAPFTVSSTTVVYNLRSEYANKWGTVNSNLGIGNIDDNGIAGIVGVHTNGEGYRFTPASVKTFLGLTSATTGTGEINYIPKWTGSNTLGHSPIYTDGTNVSIGTSSASSVFTSHSIYSSNATLKYTGVSGDATSALNLWNPVGGSAVRFTNVSSVYNWQLGAQINVGNGFEITPSTSVGGTTFTTPSLTILNNSNVGISYTAPYEKLTISSGNIMLGGASDNYGSVRGIYFRSNYSPNGAYPTATRNISIVANVSKLELNSFEGVDFYTSELLRMSIQTNGNVAINSLTASRLVATDASKNLVSTTALAFIGDDYIKNQNNSAQPNANMWIEGVIKVSDNYINVGSTNNPYFATFLTAGVTTIAPYMQWGNEAQSNYAGWLRFVTHSRSSGVTVNALTLDPEGAGTFAATVSATQLNAGNSVSVADNGLFKLRGPSSNEYALQYRDLDFRFIGSSDAGSNRLFSFGYYTSNDPTGTWNSKATINSYTGAATFSSTVSATQFNGSGAGIITAVGAFGIPLATGNNGQSWAHLVAVKADGVAEIGKYLDFHGSSNDGADYSDRLWSNAGTLTASSNFSANQLQSTIATAGGAPLTVASTTMVSNLNSQLWNGQLFYGGAFAVTPLYLLAYDGAGGRYSPMQPSAVATLLGTPTGTGTTNYIPKWTSASSLGNSLIYDNGTNVLIGTTATEGGVDAALYVKQRIGGAQHIRGIFLTDPNGTSTGGGYISLSLLSALKGQIQIGDNAVVGSLLLNPLGGNVGIGTTTPTLKLQIFGTAGLPVASGSIQTGIARFSASYGGDNDASATLDIGSHNSTGAGWIQATDRLNLASNYDLLLNPNGGKVGIGTVSPGNLFSVNSNTAGAQAVATFLVPTQTSGSNTELNFGKALVNYQAGVLGHVYNSTAANSFTYLANYGDPGASGVGLVVKAGGNVGIGYISPYEKLTITGGNIMLGGASDNYGSSRGIYFRSNYSPNGAYYAGDPNVVRNISIVANTSKLEFNSYEGFDFYTSYALRMTILTNGNIGMGISNPTQGKLVVVGTNDNGDPDIAQFLTANGTQGIGIGYNVIQAVGSGTNVNINLKPKGTGNVNVSSLTANCLVATDVSKNLVSTTAVNFGLVSGAGTRYYLPLWNNAAGTSLGNSNAYYDGYKLVVQTPDDGAMQLRLRGTADPNHYWELGRETAATGRFSIIEYDSPSLIERFTIKMGGNVGIGYSDPDWKLKVNGSGYFNGNVAVPAGNSYTDGYITWGSAQINRYGSNVELQFTPTAGSTVKIGGGGSYPIILDAYTGSVTISGNASSSSTASGALTVTGGAGVGGNLFVGGTINSTGAGTFTGGGFDSLRSIKNLNVDWQGSALSEIQKFQIRDFNYKNQSDYNRTLGFIIDEVPQSISEYVLFGEKKTAINLYSLHALSFKAHQETISEVDRLKKKVQELELKLERHGIQ